MHELNSFEVFVIIVVICLLFNLCIMVKLAKKIYKGEQLLKRCQEKNLIAEKQEGLK